MTKVHIEKPKAYWTFCGKPDEKVELSARDEERAIDRADAYNTTVCKVCVSAYKAYLAYAFLHPEHRP